jgi:hypothetical protein
MYSPSETSWPDLGRNWPSFYTLTHTHTHTHTYIYMYVYIYTHAPNSALHNKAISELHWGSHRIEAGTFSKFKERNLDIEPLKTGVCVHYM